MLPLLLLCLNTVTTPAAATPTEDLQAILVIELYRLPAVALDRFTESEDAQTRERAALALSRLSSAPGRVPRLGALTEDPDPAVRRAAAFGLGLADGGAPHLREALGDEADPEVRAGLLAALGMRGDAADIPTLVEGLSGTPVEAREAAVALGRMGIAEAEGAGAPAVLQALAEQLVRIDGPAREGAAFALARITPDGDQLTERLADELLLRFRREPDPNARAWLVRALSRAPAAQAADALSRAAADSDVGVRVSAAGAAGKLADPDALEALLGDPSWSVRLAAIHAAGAAEGLDEAEALLIPFTESDEADLAAAALSALGSLGLVESARPWLQPDKPLQVQAAAVGTLSDVEQLLRLASDSAEAQLRSAAAGRLAALEVTGDAVAALLAVEDATAASAAAAMLAERPEPALLDAVAERMAAAYDHDFWMEGLKALEAGLAVAGAREPAGLEALIDGGLRSRDPAIRTASRSLADSVGRPRTAPPTHFLSGLPPINDILSIRSARILTDAGEIRVSLDPDTAPLTVWNFAQLAERDYFDGLTVHRVVPDFVVQDGCPRGDGWGGPGYAIPDELSWARYDEGTLGMALSGPDTGGSQWFVTLSPQPHLEGRYTVFGQVSLDNGGAQRVRQGTVVRDVIIERVSR